jgi:glycosyltransferase involved in cell wall biosynthesis
MSPSKLTVALPTSTFLPSIGGVEIGLHNIARQLSYSGHQAVVIGPASHVYKLRKLGATLPYRLVAFPPKTLALSSLSPDLATILLSNYFKLLQWKYKFDIWHGTVGYPVGVALARFGSSKVPHIIRCAGDDIQIDRKINYGMRINPKVDELVKKWLPQSDAMVAITPSMQQEYENIGIAGSKILQIPNGVNLERFKKSKAPATIRKKYNLPQDAFLFLTVGRNHPKKGFRDLIQASSRLNEISTKPFAVAIAGAGTSSLSKFIAQKGLSDKMFCLGEINSSPKDLNSIEWPSDDLVNLYHSADAFVFPSHIESFGIALVEAMASSLPIITTNGPGCIDVVKNGTFGAVVPVGDTSALAMTMHNFQTDKALRTHYIKAANQRAKHFSWNVVVAKYVAAYRTLIDDR